MTDFRFRVEDRIGGTHTLSQWVTTGTVTASWDSAPTKIKVCVETDDGTVIFANPEGDLRDDGFDYILSAAPESDGCKLHYICDF